MYVVPIAIITGTMLAILFMLGAIDTTLKAISRALWTLPKRMQESQEKKNETK